MRHNKAKLFIEISDKRKELVHLELFDKFINQFGPEDTIDSIYSENSKLWSLDFTELIDKYAEQ